MKDIDVSFETITPLYTGDAWGENREIRPSSIMGCLRFWFYIYTLDSGIEGEGNEDIPDDDLNKYVREYAKQNNISRDNVSFNSLLLEELKKSVSYNDGVKEIFKRIKLPLTSRIFGCTGWRSQIEIKNIHRETYTLENSESEIDFEYLLFNKDKRETKKTKKKQSG